MAWTLSSLLILAVCLCRQVVWVSVVVPVSELVIILRLAWGSIWHGGCSLSCFFSIVTNRKMKIPLINHFKFKSMKNNKLKKISHLTETQNQSWRVREASGILMKWSCGESTSFPCSPISNLKIPLWVGSSWGFESQSFFGMSKITDFLFSVFSLGDSSSFFLVSLEL